MAQLGPKLAFFLHGRWLGSQQFSLFNFIGQEKARVSGVGQMIFGTLSPSVTLSFL